MTDGDGVRRSVSRLNPGPPRPISFCTIILELLCDPMNSVLLLAAAELELEKDEVDSAGDADDSRLGELRSLPDILAVLELF